MSGADQFIPPIVVNKIRGLKAKLFPRPQQLFDGDGAMFQRVLANCRVYGEYGVGASTNWVYAHTKAHILANETSPEWAAKVLEGKDKSRFDIQLVDVGPVGAWGRPVSYAQRERFRDYVLSIWTRDLKPDVVLVDGRFRVCCFLTSVIEGQKGLKILFDDYALRPHYHIVEEVLPIVERCGRQALFEVGDGIDMEKVARLRDQFAMVME